MDIQSAQTWCPLLLRVFRCSPQAVVRLLGVRHYPRASPQFFCLATNEGFGNSVLLERKAVGSDEEGNELVQPVAIGKVYSRGYKDDRVVCVIELETIAVDEAACGMGTKEGARKLLQEVPKDMNGWIDVTVRFSF